MSVSLIALPDFPHVQPGDDLAALLGQSLAAAGVALQAGDVLVLAQKIVSKAEGRLVRLADGGGGRWRCFEIGFTTRRLC